MIDFRYLLTTIVAVFLALAIGLLIGSGLLADEIADDLERQVRDVIDRNNELRNETVEQRALIDAQDTFARQLEPILIDGELTGDSIVLFHFDGTDEALVDRVRESIQVADGTVVTSIKITDRMALDDEGEVEELRATLEEGAPGEAEDLARMLGRDLGTSVARDASATPGGSLLEGIAGTLVDLGFIDLETEREAPIPVGADFVVVGGAEGDPPYDVMPFSEGLFTGLATEGSEVVAVEGSTSEWDWVPRLRDDDVRERVATIDHGDTLPGDVSLVVELDRIPSNEPGHYGFREGAEAIAPEQIPGG